MRSTQKFIEDACQSIHVSFDTLFTWDYSMENESLHKLYEKAKRSQWNAATDVDWSTEVDPTRTNSLQAQALAAPDDSPFKRFGTKEFERLAWESQAWTLSQFLHGEQGALLATARLVDAVPDIDAKLYAATQVMDEARHVEVFNRYLHDKVELTYPINPYLLSLLRDLLTDSRWDVAYLGMQIMVESLAMAAFGFIHQTTQEPLLKDITRMVMTDEARHVAFGVLSLENLYSDMPEWERRDRENFVCEAATLMRDRLLMREVWERMELDADHCADYMRDQPLQREFRRMLFSKVVPNVKRIGLLTPRVRHHFEQLGILEYEFEPASV